MASKDPNIPEPMAPLLKMASQAIDAILESEKSEKARLALEEQLELRENFFSLVSHDLRSPLAAARMCSEMILRRPQDAKALAVRIMDALSRADGMIRNFLDANRLQSGQSILISPENCDLHQMVQQACEEQAFLHRGQCQYGGNQSVPGRFDAKGLRRALDNLISNAFKYGDSKWPVSVHLVSDEWNAKISVHNFGNPIPAEEIENLFQWHGRTSAAKKSGQLGWGLGLMLVRAMAEAHGGRVSVTSSHEAGTTFTMTIPRRIN